MAVLGRRFRILAVSYIFVSALLAASSPPVHAQANESGGPLNGSRQFVAIAPNTAAHQFILFGGVVTGSAGSGNGRFFNDTWVWSEDGWEEQTPATRPEPRFQAAMAYDSARQEVVLFGGDDQQSRRTVSTPWAHVRAYPPSVLPQRGMRVFYGDTWVWNGTNWTQRNPAQSPSVRSAQAMAYDAARKQVVLFGGLDPEGKALNDTWVWDGTNWKKMNPVNVPPARYWAAMSYDPTDRRLVMFGGQDPSGFKVGHFAFDDTWLWDGSNWTKAEPQGDLPEARSEAAMDFDRSQRRLVLISGYVYTSTGAGSPVNDSWAWDGSRWTKLDRSEYELIFNAAELGPLEPRAANRAVIANVCSPVIWIPRYVLERGR